MNAISIVSELLWPAESVTVSVTTQMASLQAPALPPYSCATSVGGAVLQLPLAEVPSPNARDQLVMSPSGSLLPMPRKLTVNRHVVLQPQKKILRLAPLGGISLAFVQTVRGVI